MKTPLEKFHLTPQESRIALLLTDAPSRKELADALKISVSTLDIHLKNLRKKLGCQTTPQASAILIKLG